MGLKQYIKRTGKYILRGVPQINVTVNVKQVEYEKMLEGQHIIVTGGSRGLGLSIAERLVDLGASVLLVGRNEQNLEKASKKIGRNCFYYSIDLKDYKKYDDLFNYAIKVFDGYVDGMVCNAGIWTQKESILWVDEEEYDALFDTNLKAPYFLAQKFISILDNTRDNSLLFISSERAMQCDDLPYGLTKASLNSLSKGLARRFYKSKNLRVNAIAPGTMASEMTGISQDNLYADDKKMERYFLTSEVAEIVAFFMSNASKCVSGEVIACDAGEYNSSYF